jgi:hypothetical protein
MYQPKIQITNTVPFQMYDKNMDLELSIAFLCISREKSVRKKYNFPK